jgi:uncharacterized protein (DUF2252 family)
MSSSEGVTWGRVVSVLQTLLLVCTVGAVFTAVGGTQKQIETNVDSIQDLKDLSEDLLKAQITGSVNDARHMEILTELRRRVDLIERGS